MAANTSSQIAVYNMFLNMLERSGKISQVAQPRSTPPPDPKPIVAAKPETRPKAKPKKQKPKVKTTTDVDDDMEFLDQAIQLNKVCAMSDCE